MTATKWAPLSRNVRIGRLLIVTWASIFSAVYGTNGMAVLKGGLATEHEDFSRNLTACQQTTTISGV
jgi:hypothetical protein